MQEPPTFPKKDQNWGRYTGFARHLPQESPELGKVLPVYHDPSPKKLRIGEGAIPRPETFPKKGEKLGKVVGKIWG